MNISSLLLDNPPGPDYLPGFLRLRLPFDRNEIEGCFSRRFKDVVSRLPNHLAVAGGGHYLSYKALDQASDALAHAICEYTVGKPVPVAILSPHNAAAVITIVSVLKAGAIYVAVDPSLPEITQQNILNDSRAILLVADSSMQVQAERLAEARIPIIFWDHLDQDQLDKPLRDDFSPETPAAILYTTGSTGKPKGVLRSHRRLLYHGWQATHYLGYCPYDRATHLYSIAYGGSTSDIFYPLLTGATVITTRPADLSIVELDAWLRREQATVLHMPVMLYRSYVESLTGRKAPDSIRLITLSGQTVRKEDVANFQRLFASHCILRVSFQAGEFGHATEFLVDHQSEITTETVPVGYASDGFDILILDENQQPVASGATGEIAIRSNQLALEYWGQPELTAKRFIPDPFLPGARLCLTGDMGRLHSDGLLEHLGRKDLMVKIRGFRAEPEMVEKVLRALEGVKDVVVAAFSLPSGDNTLVAYVVPRQLPGPSASTLRQGLAKELPDYMVPSDFVILESLPLTPSGKIDRRGLPRPEANRPELDTPYTAPRTPYEEKLCALWAEMLGWKRIGIHDGFLDLGGDSLLAMQLTSRIIREFEIDLLPRTLFEASTVARMAEIIVQHQLARLSPEEIEQLLGDT